MSLDKTRRFTHYCCLSLSLTTFTAPLAAIAGARENVAAVPHGVAAPAAPRPQAAMPHFQPPAQPHFQAPVQPHFQPPAQPHFQPPVQPHFQPPVQPHFQAPVQPHFRPPVQPHFQAPVQPHFQPPVQPHFQAPVQPHFQAPVQPHFRPPMQPHFQAPVQPHFRPPMQPHFQAPVQPHFQPPTQPHVQGFRPVAPHFQEARPLAPHFQGPGAMAPHVQEPRALTSHFRAPQALAPHFQASAPRPYFHNAFVHPGMTHGAQMAIGAGSAAALYHLTRGAAPVPARAEGFVPGHSMVPTGPGFANPRHAEARLPEMSPLLSHHFAPPLPWARGATNIPRPGKLQVGAAGPIDPGGYIRQAANRPANLVPKFAAQQLAFYNPAFAQAVAFNNQNLLQNRAAWPWQLPSYAPGWFNTWQGNWNWQPNWWNNWNGYGDPGDWQYNWGNNWDNPYWNYGNGYGGGGRLGHLMAWLSNLLPWGVNSNLGWIPQLNYYNGYSLDDQTYPGNYFATAGYCPTPYVFDVSSGQFWDAGRGYTDYLPTDYHAPITVAVQESVPTYGPDGQITGYQLEPFYYNAFWIPDAQSYGYYDYQQTFRWLTFPWLNSWAGSYTGGGYSGSGYSGGGYPGGGYPGGGYPGGGYPGGGYPGGGYPGGGYPGGGYPGGGYPGGGYPGGGYPGGYE